MNKISKTNLNFKSICKTALLLHFIYKRCKIATAAPLKHGKGGFAGLFKTAIPGKEVAWIMEDAKEIFKHNFR